MRDGVAVAATRAYYLPRTIHVQRSSRPEMMTNHIPVDLQRVKSRFCLICGSDFSSANLRGARRSENSLRKVQLRDDRESCRCEKFAPTFDDESLKVVQSLKNVEDLGAADHERRRQRVS